MIEIDPVIIDFVTKNPVTVALALVLIKGIAKLTPGVLDDKIATLLLNMFSRIGGMLKAKKGNGAELPPAGDPPLKLDQEGFLKDQ